MAANDDTGPGEFTITLEGTPEGGLLVLNADGTFTFDPGTDFEYLADGETAVEQFVYRITNSAGTSDPISVDLTINGANDIPQISGDFSGLVLGVLFFLDEVAVGGKVDVVDVDFGESGVIVQESAASQYGTFSIDADGVWNYRPSADLRFDDFDFGDGDTAYLYETIEAQTIDGTVFQIDITIEAGLITM